MKDISILGSKLGTQGEFEKIVELFNQRKFSPVISKIFPLSEAKQAHQYLEQKEQFGKVILKID